MRHRSHLGIIGRRKLLLKLFKLIFIDIEGNLDLRHVKKVGCTLNHRHNFICGGSTGKSWVFKLEFYSFAVVFVIVAAEDKVDTWDLASEFFIVSHSHVRQSDDVLAPVLFSQLLGILCSCSLVVLIEDFDFEVFECRNPLALSDSNKADLYACLL